MSSAALYSMLLQKTLLFPLPFCLSELNIIIKSKAGIILKRIRSVLPHKPIKAFYMLTCNEDAFLINTSKRIQYVLKLYLNITVGLCVGHDILFNKHSDAPVTTLIVKDRVTGHNPVSVLYGQNFYYKRLQSQAVEVDKK